MSEFVQFDDDEWKVAEARQKALNKRTGQTSSFQGWLIRHGLAKNEKSAQYLLLAFIGFNIIVTIVLLRMAL